MALVRLRGPTDLLNGEASVSGRRFSDVIIASTGLLFGSPIFLLVVLAILIDDGRPLFFSQTRLGQFGRRFRIHKFRKFRKEVGTTGCALTVKGDARMTRLGRLLERTKLDELPQLWNILKGDMSVVGPRPESLAFANCFAGAYGRILDHRPGIFGPNQVLFRDEGRLYPTNQDPERFYREVLFPLKADRDLAYFAQRTIGSDIGWIICGLLSVIGFRSTALESLNRRFAPSPDALASTSITLAIDTRDPRTQS